MEQGNFSAAKTVSSGVSELRLDFGPGYRIYFGKDGERLVVLFGGGTKRPQQADIEAAKKLGPSTKDGRGRIEMALTRSFKETIKDSWRTAIFGGSFCARGLATWCPGTW